MSSHGKEEAKKELPEYISDPSSGKNYIRGKFLGKVSDMSLGGIVQLTVHCAELHAQAFTH